MKKRLAIVCLVYAIFCVGCASSIQQDLETARFALDDGDWDAAINHSSAVLEEDPSNSEAALLLASAYAGKSGIRSLEVLSKIADVVSRRRIFKVVHDALLNDRGEYFRHEFLREAVKVFTDRLEPLPSESDVNFLEVVCKMGLLYAIEAFGSPAIVAQPLLDGLIDVKNITEEMRQIVEYNLKEADDQFIKGDFSDDDEWVQQVRYTYCVLKRESGLDDGFALTVLQDLVLCQLHSDPDSLSGENGDFQTATLTKCSDFDFDECENAGPTE